MSTREISALSDDFAAGESLASKQYFALTLSSGNAIGVASAGGAGVGVGLSKPASGGEVDVGIVGVYPISYGGTVAALGEITPDSSGEFVASTNDDDFVYGNALEAGVDGDIRSALVHPPFQHVPLRSSDGRGQVHLLRVTFDPSAVSGDRTAAAHSSSETLPDNAVVVRSYYYVATTFTSAADTATISIGYATDDVAGIVAAIAINDGTNPWDAGWHEGIQVYTAATFSEACTAARAIDFTVAVQALTAGKLTLFLEYVIID